MPKLEIGSGEHPHPEYDTRVDILPLPGVTHVGLMDDLPFPDACFDALRANDVLEHQSYAVVPDTLREWARVLKPGAEVYIQVPNAQYLVDAYVAGRITIEQFNYWLLGGHIDRPAHRGLDPCGHPRWLWNGHHTAFTAPWLARLLTDAGFVDIRIQSDGGSNLMCWCRRAS